MALQELERQKSAKEAEILALQHANKTHEGQCKALQNQLTELNDLEQVQPISFRLSLHPESGKDAAIGMHASVLPEGGLSWFWLLADMIQAACMKALAPALLAEVA